MVITKNSFKTCISVQIKLFLEIICCKQYIGFNRLMNMKFTTSLQNFSLLSTSNAATDHMMASGLTDSAECVEKSSLQQEFNFNLNNLF